MPGIALSSILLFALAAPEPVGVVLTYGVDETAVKDAAAVDMKVLLLAVERRVNSRDNKRGEVTLTNDGRQIRVGVYGTAPTRITEIKRDLGMSGRLEFRIVANRSDHASIIATATANADRSVKEVKDSQGRAVARWIPLDAKQVPLDERGDLIVRQLNVPPPVSPEQAAPTEQTIVVQEAAIEPPPEQLEILVVLDSYNVGGEDLRRAKAGRDAAGKPCVDFLLTPEGANRFRNFTQVHAPDAVTGLKRRLGVIVNETLVAAPTLLGRIGAQGQISGNFTEPEVNWMVRILENGRLPAPLKLISESAPQPGK